MKQQVSPVVGIVIAILVVAVIGLAYMAMNKSGPAPTISIPGGGAPGTSLSLPGGTAPAGGSGPGGAGLSLPGGGVGGGTAGRMPMTGAPPTPGN